MDSYGGLMRATCWAATVCWIAGVAATNREAAETMAMTAETCVVELGAGLDDLEQRVGAYLSAYRETIGPTLRQEADE